MRRMLGAALVLCLVAPGVAGSQMRDPTPEKVTVFGGGGWLFPTGRFRDSVKSGGAVGVGGFFRYGYVAPSMFAQYGFLEPDFAKTGVRGHVDTWRVLFGGRVYPLAESFVLQPFVTALGGWAHYTSSRKLDLAPVFAPGHDDRDDAMLSAGGGFELALHPNFSLAIDARDDLSFTDAHAKGERDLNAVSLTGLAMFRY